MASTDEGDTFTTLAGDDETIEASRQALLEEIAARAEAHLTEQERIPGPGAGPGRALYYKPYTQESGQIVKYSHLWHELERLLGGHC